jgi:KaiC/GvpD/RAD55 family RecA-like ATPase
MNLTEALVELDLFVKDPDERERSWARQLSGTPSLLLLLLRDLVSEEGLTDSLETIRQVWPLTGLESALTTYYGNRQQEFVDAGRIANNLRGLIATAVVAAAAQTKNNELLSEWARLSVKWLVPKATSQQVPATQRRSVAAGPIENTNRKFDELDREGLISLAARFWSLYWLGDDATNAIVNRRSVIPVVAAGSGSAKVTQLAFLRLDVTMPAEFIEHPESALLPLGNDLLHGLARAWHLAGGAPACWRLPIPMIPHDGDSLSAAAAVALENLFRNQDTISTWLVLGRLGSPDARQLEPVLDQMEKLQAAYGAGIRYAAVVLDTKQLLSQPGIHIEPITRFEEACRWVTGRSLQDQKLLNGRYECYSPIRPDRPDEWSGVETDSGSPYIIRTWPFEQNGVSFRRTVWDNDLRTMYKLSSSPGAKRSLVVMHDAGIDTEVGKFVMVLEAKGHRTLDSALRDRSKHEWLNLKTLERGDGRRWLWGALLGIARGLLLLHRQRVIHRNVTAESVYFDDQSPLDSWRLGGFQGSWRFGEGIPGGQVSEWAVPPDRSKSTETRLEDDWYGFGMLAARCFLPIEALGTALTHHINRQVVSHLSSSELSLTRREASLIHRLVKDSASKRLRIGTDVVATIEEILRSLRPQRTQGDVTPLVIVVDDNRWATLNDGLPEPVPNFNRFEHAFSLKAKLREEFSDGSLFTSNRPGKYILRGKTKFLLISGYRRRATDNPTWERAYGEEFTVLINAGTKASLEGIPLQFRARSEEGQCRDWQTILPADEAADVEPIYIREFREFLRCTNQIELMMRCAEIFAYRVVDTDGARYPTIMIVSEPARDDDDGRHRLRRLRPRNGMIEFLRRQKADGALAVSLSSQPSLQQEETERATWNILDTDDDAVTLQAVMEGTVPPKAGFLRPAGFHGQIKLIERRKNAIDRLEQHSYLMTALARSAEVYVSTVAAGKGILPRDVTANELDESKRAVAIDIMSVRPIYSLQGPPGTGKTHLVAHLLRQILTEDPVAQVLVTAQAHPAVDVLRQKVEDLEEADESTSSDPRTQVLKVRLRPKDKGAQKGTVEQVAHELIGKLLAHFEKLQPDTLIQREWRDFLEHLNKPANHESQEFDSFKQLVLRGASIVYCTTSARDLEAIAESTQTFDWTIVEEAGRVHAYDLALPLNAGHRWLLLGDHKQLPPYRDKDFIEILKNISELADFLGTLSGRDQRYKDIDWIKTWESRGTGDESDRSSKRYFEAFALSWLLSFKKIFESSNHHGKTEHTPLLAASGILTLQYRMHPLISRLISTSFYDDKVGDGTSVELLPLDQPVWARGKAIIWIDLPLGVGGNAGYKEDNSSPYSNAYEVDAVCDFLSQVALSRNKPNGELHEVAVLAPYAQQVLALRRATNGIDLTSRNLTPRKTLDGTEKLVHTVDSFQGNQADVVIVSLVRNNTMDDTHNALGFLKDKERINVMLSRAERLLVIVGSWQFFQAQVRSVAPDDKSLELWPLWRMIQYLGQCFDSGEALKLPAAELIKEGR